MPVYNRSFWPPNAPGNPILLRTHGPLIAVQVAVPDILARHLTSQNLPVPPPVSGMALIDTGASITSVDATVFQSLSIPPVGVATTYGVHGPGQAPVFPAKLFFPGTMMQGLAFNQVMGCNLRGQQTGSPSPLIVLVGRDLLQHFVLVYNGPCGMVTLAH
jgi:hypothetical protein